MLKRLFFVFIGLLTVVLALLVFRFFYLKGMLSFRFQPKETQTVAPVAASSSPSLSFSPVVSASPEVFVSPRATPSPTPTPPLRGKLVTIDVDDAAAGLYSVDVKRGTKVTLTLNVVSANVLRGGLDFRSPLISTGVIKPGQSKTVEFTTNESVVFVPYYADANTSAPYTIRFNLSGD